MLRRKVDIVVDFCKQRQVAAEEKLENTHCELKAQNSQLAAAEENVKLVTEEIDKYKQDIGEMQDQLQKAELTFKHKVAAHERSALDNWVKARFWERKILQQSREKAYMKHRLHMMRRETTPEGSMRQEPISGRPEIWNHVQRESRPVPTMNSSTSPKRSRRWLWSSVIFRNLWRSRGQQRHPAQEGPTEGPGSELGDRMWWRFEKFNLVPLGILVCLSLWAPVRKSEDGTEISRVAALAFGLSQTLRGEFSIDQDPH
ncbi:transport and Golgi organization protein 1 homolog [Callorhinus ursinus]|uniref:transport and Golgi organization protein 1 homolog n=1 Tax=Callorhinus ursinus TaxID=34884 RepID=UPI003CD01445